MENNLYAYKPSYAIHPGEYIEELLETFGMSQTELSIRLGVTPKHLSNLINGKVSLTFELANALEKVFNGYSAKYWISLQTAYSFFEKNRRIEAQIEEKKQVYNEWLDQFDYNNLVKMGYVIEHDRAKTTAAKINNVLTFFGCSDIESWNNLYCSNLPAACRISGPSFAKIGNTSAWIRFGQNCAQQLSEDIPQYNKTKFKRTLRLIKGLTVDTTCGFDEKMKEFCKNVGVILLFVKEIPRSGICGAAYWVNGNSTPCIQMSLRFKKNDHFWFTFFHEAAHILKEHKKVVYLDCDTIENTDVENEADKLSGDFLIPPTEYEQFIKRGRFYKSDIISFAQQIGIHPGIVVGRLQHDEKIKWSWHNSLKATFTWKD